MVRKSRETNKQVLLSGCCYPCFSVTVSVPNEPCTAIDCTWKCTRRLETVIFFTFRTILVWEIDLTYPKAKQKDIKRKEKKIIDKALQCTVQI